MMLWNPVPIPVFDPSTGERASGAKAYFTAGGTTTPLTVYTTDDGSVPHENPVPANAAGIFPPVFIPYGTFGYRVVTASGDMISPVVSLVQNPAPPDSGGGGGIVVTQADIIQTGDVVISFQNGARTGFVRLNTKTIGNASSGATERANSDTEALFIWLWDKIPNTLCPVSGGRGATGAADFAAGKTIQLPPGKTRALFGIDQMGGDANNNFAGVTFGGGSATQPGSYGGAALHTLTTGEIPANIPASASSSTTVSAPSGQAIQLNVAGNFLNYQAGGASEPNVSGLVTSLAASTSTSVSVNPSGGGAHNNMPPFILVTYFMKL